MTAEFWMAVADAHWQDRSPDLQPTALAADSMQLVAQVGTAETEAAHGLAAGVTSAAEQAEEDPEGEPPLPEVLEGEGDLLEEPAPEEAGGEAAVVVVEAGGGGAAEEVADEAQGVAGLAATHWQREPTAPMTATALLPQAPTTHPTAVCWIAADLEHWQGRSP